MNHNTINILCLLFLFNACAQNNSIPQNNVNFTTISKKKFSIVEELTKHEDKSIEERIALYLKLKEEEPEQYDFSNEDELTMYGYKFLWANDVKQAIAIFKLIVQEFPGSSNAYDSLGEAYLENGETEKALANYSRSLSMDPNNFHAEDVIERIKFPHKKEETVQEKFSKIYAIDDYINDLDEMGKRLLEVHPNALKFITPEEFSKLIESKKALINKNTTYAEFRWHCNEIIASLNCSHTSMGNYFTEDEMLPLSNRFPVQVRWIVDRLYIIDPLENKDKLSIRDEIISINGVKVKDLIKDIFNHIPSQGYVETTKIHKFNMKFSILIPYALNFPSKYILEIKGEENPITLNKASKYFPPLLDPSIKRCEELLCLEFENKTAIMTVSSFNYYPWNNLDVFQKFMDKSFETIKNKAIENLIIDLRFNGGGSVESSKYLLSYLEDQPFSYFKLISNEKGTSDLDNEEVIIPFENGFRGKVYFIIDGLGNSTTGHFMSIAKALELGTIVGEELGSNHFCSAGQTICRTSKTKTIYYVANNTHVSLTSSDSDETGVLPDIYVTQSIDDFLDKKDAVKDFTLQLIDK